MSEAMIERVARAIYGEYLGGTDWDEDNYRMDERVREGWREVARAAVKVVDECIAERLAQTKQIRHRDRWGAMLIEAADYEQLGELFTEALGPPHPLTEPDRPR